MAILKHDMVAEDNLFTEHTAQIKKWAAHFRVDPEFLTQNTELRVGVLDHMLGAAVYTLTRRLLAYDQERESDEIEYSHVDYPADWWQHFKQRWFPRWALRRWPVAMTTVDVPCKRTIRYTRVCPHINLPEREHPLRWLMLKPTAERDARGI